MIRLHNSAQIQPIPHQFAQIKEVTNPDISSLLLDKRSLAAAGDDPLAAAGEKVGIAYLLEALKLVGVDRGVDLQEIEDDEGNKDWGCERSEIHWGKRWRLSVSEIESNNCY